MATSSRSADDVVDVERPLVTLHRRTIDKVLIAVGIVVAAVLGAAGGLLTWGSNFADDYVHDELASQEIYFPDEEALLEEGRDDLVGYAGAQITNGDHAEAYASYIDGHLSGIADGSTYAELGDVEDAAEAAVAEAEGDGASSAEVAALQEEADAVSAQRESLFRGETLRGLLLSTYAWSTIGQIATIASVVAFVGAGVMVLLVAAGILHVRRSSSRDVPDAAVE